MKLLLTRNNRFKEKHKDVDCERIRKEIFIIANFSNISKEDLMNRINILLIDEKFLNRTYLGSTLSMKIHLQIIMIFQKHLIITLNLILPLTHFCSYLTNAIKTRERWTPINPIPDFFIGFTSPDGQRS